MAATLTAIQTKVRRLTRSPSTQQLSDADLLEYINTFILYDFPQHLRLFDFKSTFSFQCSPFIDTYDTGTTVVTDQLFNFKNLYISVQPPIYIAGYQSVYYQSREQFFNIYPFLNSIQATGSIGDGVTAIFSGVLTPVPVLQNNVLFATISTTGAGISVTDIPTGPLTGNLAVVNPSATTVVGAINYITGAWNITYTVGTGIPGNQAQITSETVPYVPAIPQTLLYYDDKFVLRPIPNQPYTINMQVFKRPTALIMAGDVPLLEEFWQYIAYGAARKILQDRMDLDSVALLDPEFTQQEQLVLSRTIMQNSTQRAVTIYTEQTDSGSGWNGWNNGGGTI